MGTPYVPPEGPPHAKIAILGEAPGSQEELACRPFVGGSGQLLNHALARCGINRSECWITNVVKYRPPNNDFGTFYADPHKRNQPSELLVKSTQDLQAELARVRPDVIVCLGAEALRAITGKRSIGNWRGSILQCQLPGHTCKVVPTYHPAYILRSWGDKPVFEHDLRRAVEESKTGNISKPTEKRFLVRPTFDQAMWYIAECRRSKRISFDIETTGKHVRCLGISCDIDTACCIPFTHNPCEMRTGQAGQITLDGDTAQVANYWSESDEREILLALDDLFRNPRVEKVGQNIPFDVVYLATTFGFDFANIYMDTMVAQHTAYVELPKDLGFLCSFYTRTTCYWDYDASSDQSTWVYNCYDCCVTLECASKLDKELSDLGLGEFYHSHVHPTTLALLRVQDRGVKIDKEMRDEKHRLAKGELSNLHTELCSRVGDVKFNPASPKQLAEYLYSKLHLPVQVNRKSKKPTTDEPALIKLLEHPKAQPHRGFIDQLLKYRELAKLIGTYYEVPLDDRDRIYTTYNSAGTVTRRLASSTPLLLPGTNLQNPPKGDFRRMFLADEGCVFVKADLSQAEFRIVCWLARIHRLIAKYVADPPYSAPHANQFDVHRWVAALIYSKEEKDVVKKERDLAKNGVYGGNYAMQPPRASTVYKMDLKTSTFILNRYRQSVPEVPLWWRDVASQLFKTRTIISPTGGKRIFFGRLPTEGDDNYLLHETLRDAYSHSAQSIVGDLMNRALHLHEEIADDQEARICMQVHDELCLQVVDDPEKIKRGVHLLRGLMEYPLHFPGVDQPMIIPAEIKVGKNWYDTALYEEDLKHNDNTISTISA